MKETRRTETQADPTIDRLKKIARDTGRSFDFVINDHKGGLKTYGPDNSKYLWMTDKSKEDVWFVCYDSHLRTGPETTFSGMFFALPDSLKGSAYISRKYLFDRLQAWLSSKIIKSGIKSIDKQLMIKGNSQALLMQLFRNQELNKNLLRLFRRFPSLRFSVSNKEIAFIDDLRGKPLMGLYILNDWLSNPDFIEEFYDTVYQFKKEFI